MRSLMHAAVRAAQAGGEVLRSRRADLGEIRTKTAGMDLVTEADIASGVAVCEAIVAEFPKARFVVEEDEVHDLAGVERGSLTEGECWLIDPLDGTTSFVHDYPCWSVSVALLRDGVPVAGAVRNEPMSETFAAARGEGAWLGQTRLACSAETEPERALMVTGFPYDRGAPLESQLAVLSHFMRLPVRDLRRDGSAAVDCCHVALGRCDAFWEFELRPWDTAAGVVIAEEAGCVVSDVNGRPWRAEMFDILIANPALHARLLEQIACASGPAPQ